MNDPLKKSLVEVHYYPDWDNAGVFSTRTRKKTLVRFALASTATRTASRRS